MSKHNTERHVCAFNLGRLDYCDALLKGLSKWLMTAAVHPESSLTPTKWSSLHLPLNHCTGLLVCQRIHLKMLLLVYEVPSGFKPKYISDLLVHNKASTTLLDRFTPCSKETKPSEVTQLLVSLLSTCVTSFLFPFSVTNDLLVYMFS